jgi:hypothetical protein
MTPLNLIIKPSTVYHFAELLQKPYNQYEAYRTKVINENGQFISKSGNIDGLEYIAIRLKSLFNDMMPGANKYFLQSLSGTLKLFNEEFEQIGLSNSQVISAVEIALEEKTKGEVSYLNYLMEEAQHRYLDEMITGGEGGLATPAASTAAGGIRGVDFPMAFVRRKKKKKNSEKMVIEQMAAQKPPPNPYMPLQVDPLYYEEIWRSVTPSGDLDFDQITTPGLKTYLKRLSERSKSKQIFVVGNAQQPPRMLRFNRKEKPV